MFATLAAFLRKDAEVRMRELLLGIGIFAAVFLYCFGSMGFAIFAAYAFLRASEGPVEAALIIAAGLALIAVLIATIWGLRQRARRSPKKARSLAAAAESATVEMSSVRQGAPSRAALYQAALPEALKLGRELSPVQLLIVALVGGLVAGRSLRR